MKPTAPTLEKNFVHGPDKKNFRKLPSKKDIDWLKDVKDSFVFKKEIFKVNYFPFNQLMIITYSDDSIEEKTATLQEYLDFIM